MANFRHAWSLQGSLFCMVGLWFALRTASVAAQGNEFFGSLEWEQRNAGS
jgi:hypothetical protein